MPALRTSAARRQHVVGWIALTLLAFLQAPGRTAADTKFDLTADPAAFLSAATHAYTDRFTLGQIQTRPTDTSSPTARFSG